MQHLGPLIFSQLVISRNLLAISEQDWGNGAYEHFPVPGGLDYDQTKRSYRKKICRHSSSLELEGLQSERSELEFPEYGAWYLKGKFGARKILLIDPGASQYEVVRAVARFVTDNSWHSGNDHYLVAAGKLFNPRFLIEKLFFSDQPLGLHCGPIAKLTAHLLLQHGLSCRLVGIKGKGQAHIFLEVLLNGAKDWVLVDADFGFIPKLGAKSVNLSDIHVWLCGDRDEKFSLDEISARRATLPEAHYPTSSRGQVTWQPEYMRRRKMASEKRLIDLYESAQEDIWMRNLKLIETENGIVMQSVPEDWPYRVA